MSIRKNQYEQKLVDRWQYHVTKREAENFLLQLRKELYGDSYSQIRACEDENGTKRMPRLPKWAKDAFNGKLPYSDTEMQSWADDHRVPLIAVKIFGKNHHYLNEFRKMCENLEEEEREWLYNGAYETAILSASAQYEREPFLYTILTTKCSMSQLATLGEWVAETYAFGRV